MSTVDVILAPLLVILVDVVVFYLFGRMGKKSSGEGTKYEPFTGGERDVPTRGLYQSNLFVFAALFLVVEVFALILAGSYLAPGPYYPLLFLLGGSGAILLVVWWLIIIGGVRFT
ncbi:MAG: hypothetical protein JRN68_03880 [Nitrososphaerota archaeon]|jgi:NADH:ubiquinone oxidoreductase subunit 3 (subunit A)|nr:hypothetical protein [Nitrososphaerota archaeon]